MKQRLPIYFLSTAFLLMVLSSAVFSQARIVFGTSSDAYMVMNSNATVGGNPIYLVIGNSTTSAATNTITRTNYGRIISNAENNIVKWYIGSATGAYTIPWGYNTAAGNYIPFTLNITSAGTAAHYLSFTTYRTGANNFAMFPSGVTSDWSSACACNASPWMVDRLWMIDNSDYGGVGNTPTGDLTFYYVDGGASNPEVLTTGNSLVAADEANLQAESYNNGAAKWTGSLYGTDTPASDKVDGTGAIPASKLDKWWTLVEKNHPLPVQWLDLSSQCDNMNRIIRWSTATEQNADHFSVERSFDGTNFFSIGTIPASGNSSTNKNYSFTDHDAPAGTVYYRISETDFNGEFMISKQITSDDCLEGLNVSVFPNPALSSGSFNVSLFGSKDKEVLIVVTDMLGREFYSKVVVLSREQNVIAIDPSGNLAAGVYTIVASSNDQVFKKKIVIQ